MARKGKGGPPPRGKGHLPVGGAPPPGPWKEAREGEFEMMDVHVSVLGVTGIVNEFVKTKKKPIGPGPKKANSTALMKSSASITSSMEDSMYNVDVDDIPITAVTSVYKNVTSNKTKIGTHLPSLPLGMPSSAFGNTSKFVASWPSLFDPSRPSRDTADAGASASFKFSRVMKRQIIPGSWDGEDPSVIEGAGHGVFQPEMFDIRVGLARGSEMLSLGIATLVVTGGEVKEVQVNLPIKTGTDAIKKSMNGSEMKRGGSKLFKGKKAGKTNKKGVYFKFNPSSRYRLDDAAALRLLVKAVPKNGEYDVDGSVVSALSCPTGSLEEDSSEEGSSVDDYDDDYEEQGAPQTPRSPKPTKPPLSSRSPKARAKANAPSTSNLLAPLASYAPKTMLQSKASEASTEPGYGDEFEGAKAQVPAQESRPVPPIQIPAKSYSKASRDTATTKTSMSDEEESFVLQQWARSSSASCNYFSCGNLCQVTNDDNKKEKPKKVQRGPPKQVFTQSNSNSSQSERRHARNRGRDSHGRDRHGHDGHGRGSHGRGNNRGEAFTYHSSGSSSESDSSCSVGSRTFNDVEHAREKLRRYAQKMGVKPEDLV